MWTVNYLGDHRPDYVTSLPVEFHGALDVPALCAAVGDLVERHEVLRTVLPYGPGGPEQRILPPDRARPDIRTIEVPEAELDEALAAGLSQGFDLATELPLRVRLFRFGPDRHVLQFVLHHIAFDGHSLAPLRQDLRTAYLARAAGERPRWPAPAVQYADYTLWMRDRLGAQDDPDSRAAGHARYWQEALAGLPQDPALPRDPELPDDGAPPGPRPHPGPRCRPRTGGHPVRRPGPGHPRQGRGERAGVRREHVHGGARRPRSRARRRGSGP
ncbi:condensation domain-containing protein [Streptomyces sp. MST-110588]|uniref:condensation domain-containing protein n=1 Tax=Streptomyces sp. MST-110588 TaxID=2833628 RepID=UPI002413FCC0|nr:condensation domain-containing protein [Streptomyces sp. MST-110588]